MRMQSSPVFGWKMKKYFIYEAFNKSDTKTNDVKAEYGINGKIRRKDMEKKKVENRYGVQVGDIFSENRLNCNNSFFCQVVALHGESKVEVREIDKICVAFDGYYKGIVPLPGIWQSHRTHILTVQEWKGKLGLFFMDFWGGHLAYLDRSETHMYMELHERDDIPFYFRDYYPEIAEQLDLKTGSGVYALERPFKWMDDDYRAVIRYPDGREVETVLRELMRSDKISQKWRAFEAEFRHISEEPGPFQWWDEQKQIMFEGLKSSLNKNIR